MKSPDSAELSAALDAAPPWAARLLLLQGARNFRDLGGYRTADGRSVRWGDREEQHV